MCENSICTKDIKRICIIGSGASGLGCTRVLLEYGFEPVIFEQQPFIGGQWHFQCMPHANECRLTSAMYRDLITNLSCSVMQFSDFPFINHSKDAYVKVNDVEIYLFQYAEQHQLQQYLTLNTEVIDIDEDNGAFLVRYSIKKNGTCDLPSQLMVSLGSKVDKTRRILFNESEDHIIYGEYFDAICICNGHYSKPYWPEITGLDDIPESKKCHSMAYRYPEEYEGKTVVVIGGSHSGIDISGELVTRCKQVFLSMKQPNDFDSIIRRLRQSMKNTCLDYCNEIFFIKPPIEKIINGNIVLFKDGSTVEPDFIIVATGYDYEFRFLSNEKLKLQYDERRLLCPLYRQLFNVSYPQGLFSYLTIPFRVVPFPLCEVQAHVIARCLRNEVKLPKTSEMLEEINQEMSNTNILDRNYHRINMIDYVQQLFQLMGNDDASNIYNYKFFIDNDRRVRKLDKTTNTLIVEQTIHRID